VMKSMQIFLVEPRERDEERENKIVPGISVTGGTRAMNGLYKSTHSPESMQIHLCARTLLDVISLSPCLALSMEGRGRRERSPSLQTVE